MGLCERRRINLRKCFGFVSVMASISFFVFFKMLDNPLEMRMSVKDGIQTYDNLAHLVKIGSFSRNLISRQKNVSLHELRNVSSFEEEPLSSESLEDFLLAANSSSSKIIPLNFSNTFLEGDTISFRIDVLDGHYLQHLVGGDDVRVWFTDKFDKKSAVSSVVDLKNGSYTAHFKAIINGTLDVHASIVYPREYLQILMSLMERHLDGFVSALFEKDGCQEVTLCAPFHQLPNYTKICDFTSQNNNMSWYCGHPFSPNLSCSDWTNIRPLSAPSSLPLLDEEQKFISKFFEFPTIKLIPSNLKVHVKEKETKAREPPPCNKRTRHFVQSWIEKSPRGWMQNYEWRPLTCKITNLPVFKLQQCLSNSTMILIGDSSQHGIFEAIRTITKCDSDTQLAEASCSLLEWNFKMKVIAHEYPVNVQSKRWIPKDFIPSLSTVDRVPSEGKYILLLHHYLSLAPYHPEIFRERIQKTRDAVDRLIDRNPDAFVAVRGPHAIIKSKSNHILEGDNFASLYSQILKDEYRKLWRNVLYIDGWDASVAIENMDLELPKFVQFEMARILLAYACDFFS